MITGVNGVASKVFNKGGKLDFSAPMMVVANETLEFSLDAENIQMPVFPKVAEAASEVAGLVQPGKKGVTNAQMIPAMREALAADDTNRLQGLKQHFPQVYISSVKYLTKEQKAKLETLAI
jgi:hypothetical protein